jgi:hypothetical protein
MWMWIDWYRKYQPADGGLLVKTYRHGISEIFLKMVLNTKKQNQYLEIELTYRPV